MYIEEFKYTKFELVLINMAMIQSIEFLPLEKAKSPVEHVLDFLLEMETR